MSETRPTAFDPYWQWLQIPPDRRPPNHYELLGAAAFERDVEAIRSNGMNRIASVRRYQIGQHGETAIRLLGELSRAYDCLTTPERKADYDRQLYGIAGRGDPSASYPSAAVDKSPVPSPKRTASPPFNGKIGPAESYPVSSPPAGGAAGNPFAPAPPDDNALVLATVVPEYFPDSPLSPKRLRQAPRRPSPLAPLFAKVTPLFTEYLWVTLAITAAIGAVCSLPFLLRTNRNSDRQTNVATKPGDHDGQALVQSSEVVPPEPTAQAASTIPGESSLPGDPFTEQSSLPGQGLAGLPSPLGGPPGFAGGLGGLGGIPAGLPLGASGNVLPPAAAEPAISTLFVPRGQLAGHSAAQATGPPDALTYGDQIWAWASQSPDGGQEWLLVEFARPTLAKLLRVHQSFNPGAIAQVSLYDEKLLLAALRENPFVQISGASLSQCEIPIDPPRTCQRFRIEVDSAAVPGWNEIDAVELVDVEGRSHWAAWATASSCYAESGEAAVVRTRQAGELATLEAALRKEPTGLAAIAAKRAATGEATLVDAWRQAKCGEKYGMLLAQFPGDGKDFNQGFREAGYREVRSYAGVNKIPNGYWVYAKPFWYVWRDGPQTAFNTSGSWTAWQATGEPNVTHQGDNGLAWASATTDEQDEWLLLEYGEPLRAKQIVVHESYNPGAIKDVKVFMLDGRELPASPAGGPAKRPAGRDERPLQRVYNVNVAGAIGRVKVYVDSKRVPGFNEIDAVRVVDDLGVVHNAVAAEASSSYGGQYATIGGPSSPAAAAASVTSAELDARLLALERQLVSSSAGASGIVSKLLTSAPGGEPTADLTEARLRRLQSAAQALGLPVPPSTPPPALNLPSGQQPPRGASGPRGRTQP